jgi:hypothetical protein
MNYYVSHVKNLKDELRSRYDRLMLVLPDDKVFVHRGKDCVNLKGSDVRLAVDDFKSILAEIRRLT